MPRKAREKHIEAIYHIICRSVSEILLFRETEDKVYYLKLLKRFSDAYKCSVYGYCLMNNHLHLHLDPKGYDISKFMHSLNTSYVIYYNKKYDRHGHLFQERFHSRILNSNRYNLVVSAYIHNNPKDIGGYSGKEEEYEYSSYGIYIGLKKDVHNLIDKSFLQSLFSCRSVKSFIREYKAFVKGRRGEMINNEQKEDIPISVKNEYISGKRVIIRGNAPDKVISYILNKLKIPSIDLFAVQCKKKFGQCRAFVAYSLRVLCGMGYREICENIYNITISGCMRLCSKGYELANDKGLAYRNIFNELLSFGVCQ